MVAVRTFEFPVEIILNPSVVPYFLLMFLFLASACSCRGNGFYRQITSPANASHYDSIDGLRGVLALGVFFHHAVMTYNAYATGYWSLPQGFYEKLGPDSVAFFFIITGFLFWSKAIRTSAKIAPIKLLKNRLLRIAPMCLFSIFIMLLLASIQWRFRLQVPVIALISHAVGCLSLGVFLPTVNGVNLAQFNAHVFWTLRYEWVFYAGSPLLAWFATPSGLLGLLWGWFL